MSDVPVVVPPADIEAEQTARLVLAAPGLVPAASVPGSVHRESARVLLPRLFRIGLLLVLAGLLYYALRNAPVEEIGRVLAGLQVWQLILLLGLDAVIYMLVSARWWFVVRAERPSARFFPMFAVRISVFGVSYFTLGPQVGGEPLQVFYLRRNYGMSITRATASVVMDKLFELLGNFLLLAFGLVAVLQSGILGVLTGPSWVALTLFCLLISWPLIHIVLLCYNVYPLVTLLRALGPRLSRTKPARFIRAAELLAGQFCQRHPRHMLGGVLVSLLAAAATVSEYALIASLLHIGLPFWQLVTAWTSGWLSFLMPLPGGLGALEASQVWVLGVFGVSAAAAISVTLVMRARDLLIGGIGLLLAGNAARKA